MIEKLKKIVKQEDFKEILSKGFSFMIFRVGGLFFGYLFTFFIAKNYGASVNGLVALSFSILLFVSVLSKLGLDTNIVRFFANKRNQQFSPGIFYKSLSLNFTLSCLLAVGLYLTKGFLANDLFAKPQFEPYILWVSLSIPCWIVTLTCAGLLRANKKTNWYAFLDSPGRFGLSLLMLAILWFTVDDTLNAIRAHFFGVLILSMIAFIAAYKQIGSFSWKSSYDFGRFVRQSIPMMISGTIVVFLGWVDTFILGIFAPDDEVGVYSVAIKIAALTSFALNAINAILMPKIAQSFKENNKKKFTSLITFSTQLNFYLSLITIAIILIFHKEVLLFFGEEFITGKVILIILCTGQFINAFCGSVGVILQMSGKEKVYQNIVLIALLINILLNFILTPVYGSIGTAIATVASLAMWNLTGAFYINKHLGVSSFYNPLRLLKK